MARFFLLSELSLKYHVCTSSNVSILFPRKVGKVFLLLVFSIYFNYSVFPFFLNPASVAGIAGLRDFEPPSGRHPPPTSQVKPRRLAAEEARRRLAAAAAAEEAGDAVTLSVQVCVCVCKQPHEEGSDRMRGRRFNGLIFQAL